MSIFYNMAVSVYKTIAAVQSKQTQKKYGKISGKFQKYESRYKVIWVSTNFVCPWENGCAPMSALSIAALGTQWCKQLLQQGDAHSGTDSCYAQGKITP